MDSQEAKYGKSASNKRTETKGLEVLLQDRRFQSVSTKTKRRILELLPVSGDWGIQTFDAVMSPNGCPPITEENLEDFIDELRLVEMKTTRKPIRNGALNRFFFGATEREYAMAGALGDKYLFAFVVLNDDNDYGRPFFVLLSLEDVERRTRSRRIQYQVNFRTDIELGDGPSHGIGPIRDKDLDSEQGP